MPNFLIEGKGKERTSQSVSAFGERGSDAAGGIEYDVGAMLCRSEPASEYASSAVSGSGGGGLGGAGSKARDRRATSGDIRRVGEGERRELGIKGAGGGEAAEVA